MQFQRLQEIHRMNWLLEVPFTTLFEYLFQFRFLCQEAFAVMGKSLMIYSAAAVSDFYVPYESMQTHKIQSSQGKPQIGLENTPKMLYMVTKQWAPQAYNVSFKLETDTSILLDKATSAIRKYDMLFDDDDDDEIFTVIFYFQLYHHQQQ